MFFLPVLEANEALWLLFFNVDNVLPKDFKSLSFKIF